MLLMKELLSTSCSIVRDVSVFQQHSVSSYSSHDIVELLRYSISLMWPANNPDLNRVDYRIWGVMLKRIYTKYQSGTWTSCVSNLLRHGLNARRAAWMMKSISGQKYKKRCQRIEYGHFDSSWNVACLNFSFAAQYNNWLFPKTSNFRENNITSIRRTNSEYHKKVWGGRPIVQYSDGLPWALQKRLNRSRCRLGCGVGWV